MDDPRRSNTRTRVQLILGAGLLVAALLSLIFFPMAISTLLVFVLFGIIAGALWSTGHQLAALIGGLMIVFFLDSLNGALQPTTPNTGFPWWEPIVVVYAVVVVVFHIAQRLRVYNDDAS